MSEITLLWHDYETWGVDPRNDRAAQFAAIRTNLNLEEIGEPINIYCKPNNDFLPHPEAALITGLTPQETWTKGLIEAEFFAQINQEFSKPSTCGVGYNSIRFDDEVTRLGFYRNFIDPYAREWKNGNSRWDIIDLVRMTYALRPEGINWPIDTRSGKVSFRLELLTKENNIAHEGAHDALSDVRATIAMAKLIKTAQPKLYDYYFKLRSKIEAGRLLNLSEQKTVLHVSGMYGVALGCIAPVMPLVQHPINANEYFVYDLRHDPQSLLAMSSQDIAKNLYTKKMDFPKGIQRVALKTVHVNKSPALAPINTLTVDKAKQWQINWDKIEQHRQQLLADNSLAQRLIEMCHASSKKKIISDADSAIYEGFISNNDRALCNQVLKKKPEQRVSWKPTFDDHRLNTLYPRYVARNWPELLDVEQQEQWQRFCQARLFDGDYGNRLTIQDFQQTIETLLATPLAEEKQLILKKLLEWVGH
jgi:exodeoxyribonuclease-1